MTSKYINDSNYALTGYTLSGVFQSITLGPSALIGGTYGILGRGKEAYAIVNRASIQGIKAGIMLLGDAATIMNTGTIRSTGSYSFGVNLYNNAMVVNGAGGVIEGSVGVQLASGTVTNSGTIEGYGRDRGGATITLAASGTVTNEKTGVIDGTNGVYVGKGLGTLVNFGTILTTFTGVNEKYGGNVTNYEGGRIVSTDGVAVVAGTLTNSGTLSGLDAAGGGYVDNLQTGLMVGTYNGVNGFERLVNAGTISSVGGSIAQSGRYYAGVASPKAAPNHLSTIRNTGTITSKEGSGVYLDGGSVTNVGHGIIAGLFAGIAAGSEGGSVVNASTISSAGYGVDFCSVDNTGIDSLIKGAFGVLGSDILNNGTIIGTAGFGIKGGFVTNSSTGALIVGTTFGVYETGDFANLADLTNYGIVKASGTAGVAVDLARVTNIGTAALIQGYEAVAGGYLVVNSGRILATGAGTNAIGVDLVGDGQLRNRGLISGDIGVEMSTGKGGTIYNLGTIASTSGAGGTALLLENAGDALVDEAGSRFVGLVTANAGTLELTGIGGTLSGLGSAVSGFSTLDVLADSSWTFAAGDGLTGVTSFTNAGMLVNDSTLTSTGSFTNAGMLVNDGMFTLTGNTLLAGTISGTGTLALAGTPTLLTGNLTVSESLVFDGGLLGLIGHTLIMGQAVMFGGDTIEGSGSLSTHAATKLVALALDGDAVWTNDGTVTDTGSLLLGSQGSSGSLDNAAAAVFDITSDGGISIAAGGTGTVTNQGLLEKTSGTGTSTIAADLADTGRIAIATGTLDFTGTDSIAGTIGGAGTFQIGGGSATLATGAVLTVSDLTLSGGSMRLAKNLTYNGSFAQSAGPIYVAGYTLVLNGRATLVNGAVDGTGFLATYGAVALSAYTVNAGAVWQVCGTTTANGSLTLGNGGGGSGRLAVAAGGVYDITGNGGVVVAPGGSGTTGNFGLLEKTGGTGISTIVPALTNSGRLNVTSGALDVAGAVSGTGSATIGSAGALRFDGSVAQTQTIAFAGTAGGRLVLNDPSGSGIGFAGLVKGFGGKDELDLTTFAFSGNPTIGWSQTSSSSGILTVTDGTKVAKVTLFGQYAQAGFGRAKDGGSGTDITYATPAEVVALAVPHH